MSYLPRKRPWTTVFWSATVMTLLLLCPVLSARSSAEDIPHENYDLARSNLDVVIAMLNSSIVYSEYALGDMYYMLMDEVEQNLTVVRGILAPAEVLLGQIKSIAGSYLNLSELLPPFTELSSQEDSFEQQESALIAVRERIEITSHLTNLSGEQLIAALNDINTANSLVLQMNQTIDDMLISARTIIGLVVDDKQPFTHNDLIPLIERLRDLLKSIDAEIEGIINNQIPWTNSEPFMILWLERTDYHLGEVMRGGGYLFYDGHFAPNYLVYIAMDGKEIRSAKTTPQGKYSFQITIPINSSWLGTHSLQSWSLTDVGNQSSNPLSVRISLIPTTITLTTSTTNLAPPERVTAVAGLKDERGARVGGAACHLILDTTNISFTTTSAGSYSLSWLGQELGYGPHQLQAFFDGGLPYAPSSSSIKTVVVDIPTNITVRLFSQTFRLDFSIVGNGTLTANGTAFLAGKNVTISIDGNAMVNTTTNSKGGFAFSIPALSLSTGSHTLTAEFLNRAYIWRYSKADVDFTITAPKHTKYPFLPVIPGWGEMSPNILIPDLFFGKNAYLTWLLVLTLIAIAFRVYQQSKARDRKAMAKTDLLEPLDFASPPPLSVEPFNLDDFVAELSSHAAPANPNERIIWYYQRLLGFLTRRQKITFRSSMTHWEVAKMLDSLGYPQAPVESATVLFEHALYSGAMLTEDDSVKMSGVLTNILSSRSRGAANAS